MVEKIQVKVIEYGVADSNGNIYAKGCFDKSIKQVKGIELIHSDTGIYGTFEKEFKPTGKPMTTHIKCPDGRIYFAPSSEFEVK